MKQARENQRPTTAPAVPSAWRTGPPSLAALGGKRILITGAAGMLGVAFHRALSLLAPEAEVTAVSRAGLDVAVRGDVMAFADRPWDFILHCAADVNADRCQLDPAACRRVQLGGALNIIELARETGAKVYYPQSVFIFDGKAAPILESSQPSPTFVYGKYKWEAEQVLRAELPQSLVVRMAGFFGGEARDKNFVGKFARHLKDLVVNGVRRCEVGDRRWQPTYTWDLAVNALYLLALSKTGVYNMACHGEATFYEVAHVIVDELGLDSTIELAPCSAAAVSVHEIAARPARVYMENSRLKQEGLDFQRTWESALREYLGSPYFQELAQAPSRATSNLYAS